MRNGKKVKLSDMATSHLVHTIKMIERKAREGVLVRKILPASALDNTDMDYEEYTIYGQEALQCLKYNEYKKELQKRGK